MPGSIQAANINFESSGNNQLVYSANTLTVRVGGVSAITMNATTVSYNLPVTVTDPSNLIATYTGDVSGNAVTVSGSMTVAGEINLYGNITPSIIAANTANWAPGISAATIVRLQANSWNNAEYVITGMTAGTNGQVIVIVNVSKSSIWLRNEEAGSNGVIVPGVNIPASTAANRFRMPDSVYLRGYQAITMIYDGTLARWVPLDSSVGEQTGIIGFSNPARGYSGTVMGGRLGFAFDYKKGMTKGFYIGGTTPTPVPSITQVATACRTTYSTEVNAAVVGANLTSARGNIGNKIGNSDKVFALGGGMSTVLYSALACRTNYATETTASTPGAALTTARFGGSTHGNADKGFYGGGTINSTSATTQACMTYFASETTLITPTASFGAIRYVGGSFIGNPDKGYYASGYASTAPGTVGTPTVNRVSYSTDTITNLVPAGGALTQGRSWILMGSGNRDKGFISAGATNLAAPAPTFTNITCKMTYSTEIVVAVPGANISSGRCSPGAISATCKTFVTGGATSPATPYASVATADRINFTTETSALVPGANLTTARYGHGGE